MLGVLKPIIPRLYALTLNCPISSPQITTMLGRLPLAAPLSATSWFRAASASIAPVGAPAIPAARPVSLQHALVGPATDQVSSVPSVAPATSAWRPVVTPSFRPAYTPRPPASNPTTAVRKTHPTDIVSSLGHTEKPPCRSHGRQGPLSDVLPHPQGGKPSAQSQTRSLTQLPRACCERNPLGTHAGQTQPTGPSFRFSRRKNTRFSPTRHSTRPPGGGAAVLS